jgi:hypothetical protein
MIDPFGRRIIFFASRRRTAAISAETLVRLDECFTVPETDCRMGEPACHVQVAETGEALASTPR